MRPEDVDLALLYDGFTFNAVSWLEALGFCGLGEATDWLDKGRRIALDGELPVNPHGGQLSEGRTHGFGFIYEAMAQLRHEAEDRQVATRRRRSSPRAAERRPGPPPPPRMRRRRRVGLLRVQVRGHRCEAHDRGAARRQGSECIDEPRGVATRSTSMIRCQSPIVGEIPATWATLRNVPRL